jgi:hypothetical protein
MDDFAGDEQHALDIMHYNDVVEPQERAADALNNKRKFEEVLKNTQEDQSSLGYLREIDVESINDALTKVLNPTTGMKICKEPDPLFKRLILNKLLLSYGRIQDDSSLNIENVEDLKISNNRKVKKILSLLKGHCIPRESAAAPRYPVYECSVCLENLDNNVFALQVHGIPPGDSDGISLYTCGHVFHRSCLDGMYASSQTNGTPFSCLRCNRPIFAILPLNLTEDQAQAPKTGFLRRFLGLTNRGGKYSNKKYSKKYNKKNKINKKTIRKIRKRKTRRTKIYKSKI